ncbi:MAG: four-carbon acid sugar kinase family protein [Candidatus Bathyarchaeia archaeon]
MMSRFAVIADDFTGACDAGVQFRRYGLRTVVLTRMRDLLSFGSYDIIVIDSETRNDKPHIAYKKVRRITAHLRDARSKIGLSLIYKKIDSTLRGNVGAELSAVIDELNPNAVIVAPAFPEMNRISLGGRLLVSGVPLEESDFARDPIKPVKTSYIPNLIREQFDGEVALIPLSKVREGVEPLTQAARELIKENFRVIVVDAESTDDLRVIAKVALNLEALPCGSAGLAESLSYWLASSLPSRNVIVFSGSTNSVTLNQIRRAGMEKSIKVLKLRFPEVFIEREKELNRLIKEVVRAFSNGKDVIIASAESKEDVLIARRAAASLGFGETRMSKAISDVLGEVATQVSGEFKAAGIIVVGGDTAIRVMKHIRACGVRVCGEVMPGIPYGVVLGGGFDGGLVITKAGGFGREDAILRAIEGLKKGLPA